MEKVIIIGSGPAGHTAALYTARADLKPLMIEGLEKGGQLMITTDVENYPGFPEGIMGPDLMEKFRKQSERFGTRLITKNVTAVDLTGKVKIVKVGQGVYETQTVIISTGASARLLGLESEKRLMGHGVSACATCDGVFFRNQEIFVIGGGDTAMEEALFLTKFAKKVSVIHRRDQLRASKIMQHKAEKNPKINFIWNSIVEEVLGDREVTGVKIKDVQSGEVKELSGTGLFVAIGHKPNTELFKGQLEMNEVGYLKTKNDVETNLPGVFACGDVQDAYYRQAVTAAGSGCMAAIRVERYLESLAD